MNGITDGSGWMMWAMGLGGLLLLVLVGFGVAALARHRFFNDRPETPRAETIGERIKPTHVHRNHDANEIAESGANNTAHDRAE